MIFKQKEVLLNDNEIKQLGNKLKLSFLTTKILVNRGITTEEEARDFLNPNLTNLHNPFLLKDMQILVDKINDAVRTQKRVVIFGDYDVDGISATAILYKYFENHNLKVNYFLPNRYEDGYGLTLESAQKVIDLYNPQLIITVDCGISCAQEIEFLKNKGVDVVVTDHHELPDVLPNCPIVNAKQLNQKYPFKELCGAGVALKVVQALGENLDEYLPICAIATIADIVTLKDENRIIVTYGLKLIDKLPAGVKELFNELKIKSITSSDIAFKVAPKINAAGRMGDASISLQLYISNDKTTIRNNLITLTEMNTKRQELCNTIYAEAIDIIKAQHNIKDRSIVLYSDTWDSGLLGIVSARITDEFNKPTFMFSEVDGLLKGSVRSIANINIHEVLSHTSTLLETFGGHSMAAGLTLKKDNLTQFKQEINSYLYKNFDSNCFVAVKEYDLLIEPHDININFVKELDILEPFGCGNPKPLFYSKFFNLKVSQMKNYPQHLNITSKDNFSLLAFNSLNQKDMLENSYVNDCIYELQLNKYKNTLFLKGLIKTIYSTGYTDKLNDFIKGSYITQLKVNKKDKKNYFYSYEDLDYTLNKLTKKSNNGTLIICNNIENAKKLNRFLLQNNYKFHIANINSNTTNNAIIVGLNNLETIKNYENFVFLEPLLHMDYLNNFKGNLYLPKIHNIDNKQFTIDLSHDYFGLFYKKLIANVSKIKSQNKYDYYLRFKKLNPDLKKMNYEQFKACVCVFEELDFVTENKQDYYSLQLVDNPQKTELTKSYFYNRLTKLINKGN